MSTPSRAAVSQPGCSKQAPADSPQVRWTAILIGMLLVGLAFVAGREFIIWYLQPAGWTSWWGLIADTLRNAIPIWTGLAGAVAILLGVWFLVQVFTPRKKRYHRLATADTHVWLRHVDVARFATSAAKRNPQVIAASSLARKKSVTITAAVLHPAEELRESLRQELVASITPAFGPDLAVNVVLRQAGEDDGITPPPAQPTEASDE